VTDAASAMSQMAAAISGFVLAGTIVLLSQPRPSTERGTKQTASARITAMGPFVATFVSMGLTSYIFALIAGEKDGSCRRVWTAAVMGSGMLAIGAVATVGGVVLLVHAYLARQQLGDDDESQLKHLERMLTLAMQALTVVAAFLLLQRAYEYLRIWYDGTVDVGWLLPVGVIVVLLAVAVVTVKPSWVTFVLKKCGVDAIKYHDLLLWIAVFITVGYSIVATATVGFSLGTVSTDWAEAPGFLPWTFAVCSVAGPFVAIAAYTYSIRGLIEETGTGKGAAKVGAGDDTAKADAGEDVEEAPAAPQA